MKYNNKKQNTITNFIPFCEKVYLLNQQDSNISLDIPFQNSLSGYINISIISLSPIFIRNHFVTTDEFYLDKDNNKISKEFCHHNKVQYIPSSSIKGMIRNTLEIISYGKLKNKTQEEYLNDRIKSPLSLHKNKGLDLSEAIFGTTELKGRVSFSHFKISNTIDSTQSNTKKEILMTPEAKEGKFGWKNYPILDKTIHSKKVTNNNIVSEFKPLPTNTIFKGKLYFHNLRDFELGGILSSLSFHNTKDAYHNMGLAKSLGYGKIRINYDYKHNLEMLQSFEHKMNKALFPKQDWNKSEYIVELLNKHHKKQKEFKSILHVPKLTKQTPQQIRKRNGIKIIKKETKTEYTISEISEKLNMPVKDIIRFAKENNILSKNKEFNSNSILKEPQAKNIINMLSKII